VALLSPITSVASPEGMDSDEGPLEEAMDGDEWPLAADINITFHFIASALVIASVASKASMTPSMKQMAP
jgi:NAD(P)H-hydrate repair Nnr-like enzyme with NAD(P)H-hydrate epimerase domain